MEFFLQLVARAGFRGVEGTTVVGEKPPTSPFFGSGWHASLIRVNIPMLPCIIGLIRVPNSKGGAKPNNLIKYILLRQSDT